MKKYTTLLLLIFSSVAFSQSKKDTTTFEVITCTKFKITKPLRDMAVIASDDSLSNLIEKPQSKDRERRIPFMALKNPNALPQGEDPAIQKTAGTKFLQVPLVSWTGQPGQYDPPDPTGAAGPNHYVQAVNSAYKIYSKTGGTVTGGGPFNLGTLLFGSNEGDPIVLYDKFADRWVVTEFGATNTFYIGISQTADPTGQYYTYQFNSPEFPDYLKYSIWVDGYYMTSNQTPRVFVFERDQMILGNPSARSINVAYSPPNDNSFFCPLSGDVDGQLPPLGTPCPIFSYEDDGWGSGYVDRINIYNMNVTWGTTPSATITLAAQLPTTPFDASYNYNWNDISQPGTTKKLDGIGGVFTYRAQYRVWTGYNTVVLNCGVKVSTTTTQRSIRWYELRQDATTGTWSIYQQSTYTPDLLNRWVGSIAMDDNGSIGMAYAVSGVDGATSVYPSIRYTGRLASDPLNTFTFAEEIAATGLSAKTSFNRFGDYSQTSIDPVDGTIFWHTGEYISSGGNPATKIFSFQIPYSVGVNDIENPFSLTLNNSEGIITIKAVNLPSNEKLAVDLFDITGKKLSGKIVFPASYSIETTINSSDLTKGTYLVRIGNFNTNFQKVSKIIIE